MRLTIYLLVGLLPVVTAAGCNGSGKYQTRGRVLKDGAPLVPDDGEFVRVTFVPILAPGERPTDYYTAAFNPTDGTFQAAGKDGQGVPPGKYRIAVEHFRNNKDLLKGAFDGQTSPLIREVKTAKDEIIVDLSKPD
jgi:hypothetical protein